MDTTEINFPSDQPSNLVLTPDAKYFLHTAARWANFLAILGFILTGFVVLGALYWLVLGGTIATTMSQNQGGTGIPSLYGGLAGALGSGMGVIYLLIAVFYFLYSFYLYKFASSTKKAVLFNSIADITIGFKNLKSFFKLWGIITIVAIAIGILAFIGVIIFAAGMASSLHS